MCWWAVLLLGTEVHGRFHIRGAWGNEYMGVRPRTSGRLCARLYITDARALHVALDQSPFEGLEIWLDGR